MTCISRFPVSQSTSITGKKWSSKTESLGSCPGQLFDTGVFQPAKMRGRNLVDGGLMNPVPTKTVRDMGADFVISVNVLPYKAKSDTREPNIFSIMMKAFYILDSKFIETSIRGADVVIEPDVVHIAFTDFQRTEECIEKGAAAARKMIPEIKKKLALS